MSVTIYADLMSQPSRAVIWFCKLANITHNVEIINIAKLQTKTEDFKAKSPFGKVPAIQYNGNYIHESHTILRYLAQQFNKEEPWYSKDLLKRAKIDQYLDWKIANLLFATVLGPRMGQPSNPNYVKLVQKEVDQTLDGLENVWLKETPFIAGDKITIADLSAYEELASAKLMKWDLKDKPRISNWMSKMESQPFYKEVHEVLFKVLAKM